jgi:hypothetical protein
MRLGQPVKNYGLISLLPFHNDKLKAKMKLLKKTVDGRQKVKDNHRKGMRRSWRVGMHFAYLNISDC